MTALFKTDNIFYLPAGSPFRIYDLLDWRRIDLDVQSLQILLRRETLEFVHERAHLALEHAELLEEAERERQTSRMESFLGALRLAEPGSTGDGVFAAALHPMRSIFWVRVSQEPMESFFAEDYEESPDVKPGAPVVLRTIGAVAFNAFGEIECELPSENPYSFELAGAASTPMAASVPLAPDEPLPLLREYCGLNGSSNQGEMVTIDLNAKIPEGSLAAIPIRRQGQERFETLYLHLATDVGGDSPLFPFRFDQETRVGEALKQAGFHPIKRSRRFSVWERGQGQDTIQLYRLLEGKESERTPVLPSFCLATQANGSAELEGRVALLAGVFLG